MLQYVTRKSMSLTGLSSMIDSTRELTKRKLLDQIRLLGAGETILLAATEETNYGQERNSWVIQATNSNSTYDLIVVNARQIKQFDKKKLLACGLVTVFVTGLGTLLLPPYGGLVAGIVWTTVVVGKAVVDYRLTLPDVIHGYILKDMNDKNLLIHRQITYSEV